MASRLKGLSLGAHQTLDGLMEGIRSFSPPNYQGLEHLNILLVGPVGAGKSSYVNTVCSVFKGRLYNPAYCGSAAKSMTTEYRTYTVRDEAAGRLLSFRLCDTRGLEESEELDVKELECLLDGNIADGYQHGSILKRDKKKKTKLNKMKRLVHAGAMSELSGFQDHPSHANKIHCVCFVLDGSTSEVMDDRTENKIKEMQTVVRKKDIPHVFLITKIDLVGVRTPGSVSQISKSESVLTLAETTATLFGVPRQFVLPVKNFENEAELPTDGSILALQALQTMLTYAGDFLSDRKDRDDIRKSSSTHLKDVMKSSDSTE